MGYKNIVPLKKFLVSAHLCYFSTSTTGNIHRTRGGGTYLSPARCLLKKKKGRKSSFISIIILPRTNLSFLCYTSTSPRPQENIPILFPMNNACSTGKTHTIIKSNHFFIPLYSAAFVSLLLLPIYTFFFFISNTSKRGKKNKLYSTRVFKGVRTPL